MLVLITNRKLCRSFRLVPKSVMLKTLNGVMVITSIISLNLVNLCSNT